MWGVNLGQIETAKNSIELISQEIFPIKTASYWAEPKEREFRKTEIDKMLCMNVIEPPQIEWASPIVSAPKKDGVVSFCIDYRKLIAVTVKETFAKMRLDKRLDKLDKRGIISTCESNSGGLENRDWGLQQRKNKIHATQQTVNIFGNAFRSEKPRWHVPASDEPRTIDA